MLDKVRDGYLTAATHCARCVAAGHPDCFGSERRCAFPPTTGGVFSEENWNCATMNLLRDLAYRAATSLRWNDQSIAVLPFSEFGFVVLSYYKDRGRTELAYVAETREPLTLEGAEDVIAHGEVFVANAKYARTGGTET